MIDTCSISEFARREADLPGGPLEHQGRDRHIGREDLQGAQGTARISTASEWPGANTRFARRSALTWAFLVGRAGLEPATNGL